MIHTVGGIVAIDNTIAIRDLIKAMTSRADANVDAAVHAAVKEVVADAKATTKAKPEAKKQEKGDAGTSASKPEAGQGSSDDTPAGPTYDEARAKILDLSQKKGRDVTVALLQRFGATKGPELKESQYAEFIADADRVIAGEYDPMASELA